MVLRMRKRLQRHQQCCALKGRQEGDGGIRSWRESNAEALEEKSKNLLITLKYNYNVALHTDFCKGFLASSTR